MLLPAGVAYAKSIPTTLSGADCAESHSFIIGLPQTESRARLFWRPLLWSHHTLFRLAHSDLVSYRPACLFRQSFAVGLMSRACMTFRSGADKMKPGATRLQMQSSSVISGQDDIQQAAWPGSPSVGSRPCQAPVNSTADPGSLPCTATNRPPALIEPSTTIPGRREAAVAKRSETLRGRGPPRTRPNYRL